MESILITINIVLAVMLVIVILLQRSEGGALGLGVSQDNFTTSRSAGTFLTKFTSILATLFIRGKILLGIPFWYGAIGVVVFTGIYTVIGGMKAVIYTETLQAIVLILGSVIITYLGLQEVGGWNELRNIVIAESPDHFNMWRPMSDPDFPWTGLLIGGTIVGIWYWCTDQYIVQRTLAAHNIKIGRRGAIFGAYLKLLPILIFLIQIGRAHV